MGESFWDNRIQGNKMSNIEKFKPSVPTIEELFSEDLQMSYKHDAMNLLLSREPKKEWVKEHPFIKGYRYIPIDKVEYMLRSIFKRYRIEVTGQGTAFNGVWVTVRVHYFNPASGEMEFHDGIGACQLQTKKDTSPSDLININNGALSMAFPIAKTIAIKDACDHFGNLFGANLNRKDVVQINEVEVDDIVGLIDFVSNCLDSLKETEKELAQDILNKYKNGEGLTGVDIDVLTKIKKRKIKNDKK